MITHQGDGEFVNGVFRLILLFFLLGSILARVGHGMSLVSVGAHVHEGGPDILAAGIGHILHAFIDVDDIHAIDNGGVDAIGSGLGGEIMSHGRAAGDGGAHRVAVIFADEDDGQVQDAREVHRFVKGSLVQGPIAQKAEGDPL